MAGIYGFSFAGTTCPHTKYYSEVLVLKDGKQHHRIQDANNVRNNIGGSWMLKLRKGEETYLQVTTGKLFADLNIFMHFNGQLLKADE